MKKLLLLIVIIAITTAVYSQNQYDVNMLCLDSIDGDVFWGISDSTDVRLLKFSLGTSEILTLDNIDLPDTLIYKQIMVFNEDRIGIVTETNTYIYVDQGILSYYDVYTPIKKTIRSSNSSMYVLFSSGVIAHTYYNFQGGNQFCSQNNTVDNISCFDINLEAPLKLVCGGYEVLSNNTMAQISLFNELEYYSVPIISYGYGEYSEINNVINDESGIYVIAKKNMVSPGVGSFSLIKISQSINFNQEILVNVATHYFAPMFLVKNGSSIYFAMGTTIARYDLNTTGVGWQTVLSTSYGDIAKSMFIVGDKLVASFEHSGYYGYFITLDLQDVTIDDNVAIPEVIVSSYPNPFNLQTNIRFDIPKTGQVTLQIYNIKGQLIRTLVNEIKSAGGHEVIWNGRDKYGEDVSGGIYFYKISSGKFSSTRKIILMK